MFNIQNLLEQAKNLQQKMSDMEQEIANWQESGDAGGGLVSVTLNGKGAMIDIKISVELLKPEEKEILADLIKAAFNQAKEKLHNRLENHKKNLFAGIPMPPNFKLPF